MEGFTILLSEAAPAVVSLDASLKGALQTGAATAAQYVVDAMTAVLPYALGLAGVIMSITICWIVFRRFAH